MKTLLQVLAAILIALNCFTPLVAQTPEWTITKVLSKSGQVEESERKIIVRNCLIEEKKTCSCSSSESSEQNYTATVAIGGELNYFPAKFGAKVDLAAEFQFGKEKTSGESLELPTAPDGKAFVFTVKESYIKYAGKALARSSTGDEKVVDYILRSTCGLSVTEKALVDCGEVAKLEANILDESIADTDKSIQFEDRVLGDWIDERGNVVLSLKSESAGAGGVDSHQALSSVAKYVFEDSKAQNAIEACAVKLGFPPNSELESGEIRRVKRVAGEADGVYFAMYLPGNNSIGAIFTEAERDSLWGGKTVRLLCMVFRSDNIVDLYSWVEWDGTTLRVAGVDSPVENACLAYTRLKRT